MKYISLLRYLLIVISVIVVVLGVGVQDPDSGASLMLGWAEGLLVITIAAVILLQFYNMIKNPKSAVRSLLGLACIVVVMGLAYALSDTTPIVTPVKVYDDVTILRMAGMELMATYVVFGLAVLAIAGTELYNLVRK